MNYCYLALALLAGPALAQAPVTFAPVSAYSSGTGGSPYGVAVADLNGDKLPDIVTANFSGTVGVLLGQATGGFSASSSYVISPSYYVQGVAIADVNGDGQPDIVTANYGGSGRASSVGVLRGKAGGGFAPVSLYSTGFDSNTCGVTVADVNGDGQPDIVTANSFFGSVGVLAGKAGGGFAPVSLYAAGGTTTSVAVADVNRDGRADLVAANYNVNGTAGVLLGQAGGGFAPVVLYSTGGNSGPYTVAVADLNGDGWPDIVTANYGTHNVGVLQGQAGGGFAPISFYATGPNSGPQSVAVADMNNDGQPDVVTANYSNSTAGVLLGQVGGGFAAISIYATTAGGTPYGVAVADLNGDGWLDIVTADGRASTASVLLNATAGLPPTLTALPGTAATLAPNPATTSATLTATGLPAAAAQLAAVLLNPLGHPVRRLTVPATAGAAMATVPTAGLAAGLYLLRLNALDAQGAGLGALPTQRLSIE